MDYYYYRDNKWIGPVSSCFLNDLARSGKIKPDTPVKVNRNILLASSLIGIKFPTEEDKKNPEPNYNFRAIYWLSLLLLFYGAGFVGIPFASLFGNDCIYYLMIAITVITSLLIVISRFIKSLWPPWPWTYHFL